MADKPQTLDISASLSDDSQEHFSKLVQKMDEKEKTGKFYMVLFFTFTLEIFNS